MIGTSEAVLGVSLKLWTAIETLVPLVVGVPNMVMRPMYPQMARSGVSRQNRRCHGDGENGYHAERFQRGHGFLLGVTPTTFADTKRLFILGASRNDLEGGEERERISHTIGALLA
jgi:hypothetical protein